MKAFHTIAIPHQDILQGRLGMEVFAADLWAVSKEQGPEEYRNGDTFFRKTYLTGGLANLLTVVERRLNEKGGDPVIQIQTPFGGGKTHALIALYHKSAEWDVKRVVIVGEKLRTGATAEGFDTLWGVMEEQLTGSKKDFFSSVPPGGEQIKSLLQRHRPLLILMDELIPYLNVAGAVYVGERTLASLTLSFLQTLSNIVSEMSGVCLLFTTTPSNPYDKSEKGEEIVLAVQSITARRDIIKAPVEDDEISRVIRRRLFSSLNEGEAKEVVTTFVDYAEREGILPAGVEASQYRNRFLDSYPFMPEVVDVLYQRWGSFPTFQRTRGVLRLLSLMIHSLQDSGKPYISMADFDLSNQEIRQEFLRHIGSEFNGIIGADITGDNPGCKKVDVSLGNAYRGFALGTRAATTVFLYSFSGGPKRGATLGEIKRSATTLGNPAGIVAEATEQLKNKLFFLQSFADRYFFSNQPNLNRIVLTKMDNIKESQLLVEERDLLEKRIKGDKLQVFVWEENSSNIPDSEALKLVVLPEENQELMKSMLRVKGQTPRVYRNTLLFLYPLPSKKSSFLTLLKRKKAYELIAKDKNLGLSGEQKKEISKELKRMESEVRESVRGLYRMIGLPEKDGPKQVDLGIPTYGEEKALDQEVYEKLRSDGAILEKTAAIVIREKYLTEREYISPEQIYQSSLKTPGETRIVSQAVLERAIKEGVQGGLFGLGELKDEKPVCRYFREPSSIGFTANEVIITEKTCREQKKREVSAKAGATTYVEGTKSGGSGVREGGEEKIEITGEGSKSRDRVQLRFQVPKGKVANLMGLMNLLQEKFETLELDLSATNGAISEQDYEDKIKETFRQLGIKWEEE